MAKSPSAGPGWASLTWDDLTDWAGTRSVERGRSYQRGGRVKDLRVSADGALLASVIGTHRYATTVSLEPGKKRDPLDSACSCPIGGRCKHAVAVVAEYLDALANSRAVATTSEDDPRWEKIEAGPMAADEWYGNESDDWEDDEEDDNEDESDEEPVRVKKSRPAPAAAKSAGNWDEKIERHIRAKPPAELADLVCSLVRRFPELSREFQERIALQEGDASQLVDEARREIRKVTAVQVWRSNWTGEGQGADYSPIRRRLERLLELGHADEVVELGRELLKRGLQQVGSSNDEGETALDLADALKVVGRAVLKSTLSGSERLLFAADARLQDDYDTTGDATEPIFAAATNPEDWSAVADVLLKRLRAMPSGSGRDEDSYSRGYARDRLTSTIADALRRAGRDAEVGALYESEVRATQSYERFVRFLLEAGRVEDAERWAKEGIAATREKWPGIAAHLAEKLRDVAAARKQWDVVAAHAALAFFERPSPHGFEELMKAAKKAKVEDAVRAAALKFLETGAAPFRLGAAPSPKPAPKSVGRKKSAAGPPPAPPAPATPASRLKVDPAWPLPVPDYFAPLLDRRNAYDPGPRPHLGVLLEMAIAAKKPDEVLRWYDRMRAAPRPAGYYQHDRAAQYAERVADAVATTHPQRAVEVYRTGLEANLRDASPTAYDAATKYLRKLRPVYAALGRPAEWTALLAKIREEYKRRRTFMEKLDSLEGKSIIESARKAKK